MRQQGALFSTKNDTETAIIYSRNRWTAFTRFLDDGRVCLSNNPAELALRTGPLAARTLAMIAQPPSIRWSDLQNDDVDPQAWLADVLARPPDHHASKSVELESLSTIQGRSCSLKTRWCG
jgi:transposase